MTTDNAVFDITESLKEDVLKGFSASNKYIPSKYFYDQIGDKIFQEIMGLPEYYLTRAEGDIFNNFKSNLRSLFGSDGGFNLVELGAGDGLKTSILIDDFIENKIEFKYYPIDISENSNISLKASMMEQFPELKIELITSDYFSGIEKIKKHYARNVVLFLGSNIGNFSVKEASSFLKELKSVLSPNDLVLIGFDLKKNPKVVLDAYNDKSGVTKRFNLNLLTRINHELGADFKLENFDHCPTYDHNTGEVKSFLKVVKTCQVYITSLEQSFSFTAGELIHTEISQKYDVSEIKALASKVGFELKDNFFDENNYFVNSLWINK